MPDALSKTVPVWCCVLNRVMYPDQSSYHDLYVPPSAVSDSEQSQMAALIPGFVESFHKLGIEASVLRSQVHKPLRPFWVTQETQLLPTQEIYDAFHPVICCTSSRRVIGAEMSEGGYIQGAGDDTENWAAGLTPPIFWGNIERLLSTPESQLKELITALVSCAADAAPVPVDAPVKISELISVGRLDSEVLAQEPAGCTIALLPSVSDAETWEKSPSRMEVGIGRHKVASRNLRQALPRICAFVSEYLAKEQTTAGARARKHLLVTCETGKDISVGVALVLSCCCFDEAGQVRPLRLLREQSHFSKETIRVRLAQLMTSLPEANPSRATLQSVNSFLLDWRG